MEENKISNIKALLFFYSADGLNYLVEKSYDADKLKKMLTKQEMIFIENIEGKCLDIDC